MASWLPEELERIHRRLRAEERAGRAEQRKQELRARVATYLAEHPEASANAVAAEIEGRRREVLQAVKELRAQFPSPGNHQSEVGA